MELYVNNARTAAIVDDVKLPTGAARAVRAHATLRKKAEQEDRARPSRLGAPYGCCAVAG